MDRDEFVRSLRDQINLVEPIYVIESPSSRDLYDGRNEGDALAKTLKLGSIEVAYYLAPDMDMLERAFLDIGAAIKSRPDIEDVMPFIHISAHGGEEGIQLTDYKDVRWAQLSELFCGLHKTVGKLDALESYFGEVPKTALSLSSCSSFTNYKKNLPEFVPFQAMIGPNIDVGWCQSLVGFSTFYYQAFLRKATYWDAVDSMNAAAASTEEPIFELLAPHITDEKLIAATDDIMQIMGFSKEKDPE